MLALPIFPGRLQPSIFSASELNFRVRDGNGWTLTAISTNYILAAYAVKTDMNFFEVPMERLTDAPWEWCAFRDSNPGPTD